MCAALVATLVIPASAQALNWSAAINLAPGQIVALTCPSASLCVSLTGTGSITAYSFNPATPAQVTSGVIDATGSPVGLACSTASECVATDSDGDVTAFDPSAPALGTLVPLGNGAAAAVTCAANDDCWVTGAKVNNGSPGEVEVSPANPDSTQREGPLGITPSATSCGMSADLCFGVSGGDAVMLGGNGTPSTLTGVGMNDLSCTGYQGCTAVGFDGDEITFQLLEHVTPIDIDGGVPVTRVSCPVANDCYALDIGGRLLEGNPTAAGWSTSSISTVFAASEISCSSDAECVASLGENIAVGVTGTPPTGPGALQPTPSGGLGDLGDDGDDSGSAPDTGGSTTTQTTPTKSGDTTVVSKGSGSVTSSTNKTGAGTTIGRPAIRGVKATGNGVEVALRCTGAKTARCTFKLSLAAGISSGAAASGTFTLKPGTKTVRLTLVKAALRMLKSYGTLGGVLTIDQRLSTGWHLLVKRSLTMHAARS